MPIVLENLSFSYGRDPVLRHVDLSIEDGLVHLAVGPTGCGKTTLALLMVGLLRPLEGRILVDGSDPASSGFPRQTVQLAFQFPETQMFELTVEKEIAYGLKNFGLGGEECRKRAAWALGCMGLSGEFLSRDPHNLSFGERRKVALASVIALKPKYLILDEPLAGLDWNGRKNLVGAVETLKGEGITTIVLTHETDLIGEVGDTILSLADGMITRPRPPADFLYSAPTPDGLHVPEFIRLLKIVELRSGRLSGRPYRLDDVAEALIKALPGSR